MGQPQLLGEEQCLLGHGQGGQQLGASVEQRDGRAPSVCVMLQSALYLGCSEETAVLGLSATDGRFDDTVGLR